MDKLKLNLRKTSDNGIFHDSRKDSRLLIDVFYETSDDARSS